MLALLAREMREPMVGDAGTQFTGTEVALGEFAPTIFRVKNISAISSSSSSSCSSSSLTCHHAMPTRDFTSLKTLSAPPTEHRKTITYKFEARYYEQTWPETCNQNKHTFCTRAVSLVIRLFNFLTRSRLRLVICRIINHT